MAKRIYMGLFMEQIFSTVSKNPIQKSRVKTRKTCQVAAHALFIALILFARQVPSNIP